MLFKTIWCSLLSTFILNRTFFYSDWGLTKQMLWFSASLSSPNGIQNLYISLQIQIIINYIPDKARDVRERNMECQERIGISMDQMGAGWVVWLNQWAGEVWQKWTCSVLLPWKNQTQVGRSNSYLECWSPNRTAQRGLLRILGKWRGA